MRKLTSLIAIVLALSACDDVTAPHAPLKPPATYRQWFSETVRCADRYAKNVDYRQLRFFIVKGDRFLVNGAVWAAGAERRGDIWLSEHFQANERVVKHEMMHYITGFNTHPQIFKTCHLVIT